MTAIADRPHPDECHAQRFSLDVERLTLKSPPEVVNPVARGGSSDSWVYLSAGAEMLIFEGENFEKSRHPAARAGCGLPGLKGQPVERQYRNALVD
jgi:hypothetical protein